MGKDKREDKNGHEWTDEELDRLWDEVIAADPDPDPPPTSE